MHTSDVQKHLMKIVVIIVIQTMEYCFQLEVKCLINLIGGHVLLSSCMTTPANSSCSLREDGTRQHHHTSVSCSSKVCQLLNFTLLQYVLSRLCHNFSREVLCHRLLTARYQHYNKKAIVHSSKSIHQSVSHIFVSAKAHKHIGMGKI